ncbi:unnamed protein product [Sympodiomycopsis kandeliae]
MEGVNSTSTTSRTGLDKEEESYGIAHSASEATPSSDGHMASPASVLSDDDDFFTITIGTHEQLSERVTAMYDDIDNIPAWQDIISHHRRGAASGDSYLVTVTDLLQRLKLERCLHELYISLDKLSQVSKRDVPNALRVLEWVQQELSPFYMFGVDATAPSGINPPLIRLQCAIKILKREAHMLVYTWSRNIPEALDILSCFHTYIDNMQIEATGADEELDARGIEH